MTIFTDFSLKKYLWYIIERGKVFLKSQIVNILTFVNHKVICCN